jgi:PTS system mannose-specific IID component
MDLWRMAARMTLLQATFNYERQQGLGWAWALQPALERLYPDPEVRRERLAEHTAYFNTQPTLASLALGAVASFEERRAAGEGPDAAGMARIKSVLGSSLAALGDRLFWFTLRPFVACLGVLVALGGSWLGAVALWVCYNILHLGVRFLGVGWGYRAGTAVLGDVPRGRFERLTERIAVIGTMLVGLTAAVLLVPTGAPRPVLFEVVFAAGLGLGLVAGARPRPSPTEWALGVGVLCVIATWFR